ncbi:MAG: hypothetical protein IPH54_21040 [Rhodoferax sp.]|nr:hypothetical protein [Rhodoferax sp.]
MLNPNRVGMPFSRFWVKCMIARPDPLVAGQNVTFNGSVDANLGKTPKGYVPGGMHGSHDLGMAFDMDVSRYIADANQGDATDGNRTIAATTGGWSVGNATTWSGYLPHNSGNGQRQALRDFLSLYALTQSDGWADLNENFTNGVAARNALFGEGNQTNGLISSVLIGDLQKDFDIQPGDVDMLVLDQVIQDEYQLPQTVMVASTQTGGAKKIPKIGRCDISYIR